MCLAWNQPWFISSTKRTGSLEQCERSSSGCMSAKFTMRPSSATNAAVKGSSVFFIQKHCTPGSSNTNNMPSWAGIDWRCISPIWRSSKRAATCASMRYMPARSSVRGKFSCGDGALWACAAQLADSSAVKASAGKKRRVNGFMQLLCNVIQVPANPTSTQQAHLESSQHCIRSTSIEIWSEETTFP